MSSDWYRNLANSTVGAAITQRAGLPRPAVLRRYEPGQPLVAGPALVGSAGADPRMVEPVTTLLRDAGVDPREAEVGGDKVAAVVLDATGVRTVPDLAAAQEFLSPAFKRLGPSGRLVLLGSPPGAAGDPEAAAAGRALEGLMRSAGKEARAGATVNLLSVGDGAEAAAESSLRFFLSARSAFVSGQAVTVNPPRDASGATPETDWDRPLAGRVAVVTGAARGIGASIAEILARDGASVVCVDIPASGDALAAVANRVRGVALQLDITAADAPARLIERLRERGGLDLLVHNAGITKDKLLVNMTPERWSAVLAVNLQAQLRINAALLEATDVLREGSRIVCISSTSGIAGNRGQTNYAASKAGIIGMVQASAPTLADRGATINAVAPGFIETEMTKAMPFATREAARRLNSLSQGGLPTDVAETVAWLGQQASGGVNGQVIRVCGQSMLGA